jgi:hypothetical protein
LVIQGGVEDDVDLLLQVWVFDGRNGFDAFAQVSLHPISAADEIAGFAVIEEIENA